MENKVKNAQFMFTSHEQLTGWRPEAGRPTYAVLSVGGELKTGIADALETSVCVDAAAITAHDAVHDAFVYVWENSGRSPHLI